MRTPIRQNEYQLVTSCRIRQAEQKLFEAGVLPAALMEQAGTSAARDIRDMLGPPSEFQETIVILIGPGQNGGDGYIIAADLVKNGYSVEIISVFSKEPAEGAAVTAFKAWQQVCSALGGKQTPRPATAPYDLVAAEMIASAGAVVDAIFGIGFKGILTGSARAAVQAANDSPAMKIAIDVASGVCADTGRVEGTAFQADTTLTFAARKPGHLIAPGRFYSGDEAVSVIDIGLDLSDKDSGLLSHNVPDLWAEHICLAGPATHKYDRGHLLVLGGCAPTLGASRLASLAALRAGCGLVTLAVPAETYAVQAAALTDVLVTAFETEDDFTKLVSQPKISAVLIGPGAGNKHALNGLIENLLAQRLNAVFDADALAVLHDKKEALKAGRLDGTDYILTPHEGEFRRLFPDLNFEDNRLEAARGAAQSCGSIVVMKGVSTIIADPSGRASITTNAPANLSVAGTGDVLAGIIASFLVQGMPAFEAACAGVWVHGEAAQRFGRGMIASDLLTTIPEALPF